MQRYQLRHFYINQAYSNIQGQKPVLSMQVNLRRDVPVSIIHSVNVLCLNQVVTRSRKVWEIVSALITHISFLRRQTRIEQRIKHNACRWCL